MTSRRDIDMRSKAIVNAESHLKQYANITGKPLTQVRKRHGYKLEEAIVRYSQAKYRELGIRLFVLPRELRDLVYKELWGCNISLMDQLIPGGHKSGRYEMSGMIRPCSGKPDHGFLTCRCTRHLPDFAKRELVGEEAAIEVLETFPLSAWTQMADQCHLKCYVSWRNLHDLATAKIFHSGLTLHELFENMHLFITFDCLGEVDNNEGLERIGIPGNFNTQLHRCVESLSALRSQKPRPITFKFVDETTGVPSNVNHLFRSLSASFHELRHLGFDVRVVYQCYGSKWDMNKTYNSHGPCTDVWTWSLRDWNLNFTRVNDLFERADMWGEAFIFNPNGPLKGRFRVKKPVWEAMRKKLYRAYPEVDTVVKWTRNSEGEIWMNCGRVDDEHTCCTYYLCSKHGGWDVRSGKLDIELNTYCYICKGLVAPVL